MRPVHAPTRFVQNLPVAPHKAMAEVSQVENVEEKLVAVNHGQQSQPTGGL